MKRVESNVIPSPGRLRMRRIQSVQSSTSAHDECIIFLTIPGEPEVISLSVPYTTYQFTAPHNVMSHQSIFGVDSVELSTSHLGRFVPLNVMVPWRSVSSPIARGAGLMIPFDAFFSEHATPPLPVLLNVACPLPDRPLASSRTLPRPRWESSLLPRPPSTPRYAHSAPPRCGILLLTSSRTAAPLSTCPPPRLLTFLHLTHPART